MNRKRLILFILFDLVLFAVLAWFLFQRFGGTTLDRPVTLVPPTADLYLEVASFARADTALREISATAGLPVTLPMLFGRDQDAMARALADPAAAGVDASRPIGFAMNLRFDGAPVAVAFLPVNDAGALAAKLDVADGVIPSDKAVAFQGGWIAHLEGYALVADQAATIDDLLALETRGLALDAPEPDAVMTLWLTPNLFATARTLVDGFPAPEGKAARFARELASLVVGSIERASIGLLWSDDGLRLSTRWHLAADNPLTPALRSGANAADLLAILPPGALLSGLRIEPEAGRRLAAAALARTHTLFDDTEVVAMMERSLDLVSREAATSVISWGDGSSNSVRSVSIQSVAKGREADFVAFQRYFQREGAALWETMMRDGSGRDARISFKDLPTERAGDLDIAGSEMRTLLDIEPFPGADAATRAAFERLRDQRVIQRFTVVERPNAEPLFITTAGEDPAIIRNQIDLVRSGGPNAAGETAVRRVMTMLGGEPVAFMIVDPLRTDDGDPAQSGAIGVAARAEENVLVVEAVWPRDHLAAIPQMRFPFPLGAPPPQSH